MNFRFALCLALLLLLVPGLARAQNCTLGTASSDLDINNVRARLYNNGGLFWKGAGNVYNVPKAAPGQNITPNSIFAAGLWMGGKVGGQTRMAAAAYGNWELYPGPLDAAGSAPTDCAPYDRIFTVTTPTLLITRPTVRSPTVCATGPKRGARPSSTATATRTITTSRAATGPRFWATRRTGG